MKIENPAEIKVIEIPRFLITIKQLSEATGISIFAIREKVRKKVWPAYKEEGVRSYLFKYQEIIEVIEKSLVKLN